MTSTNATTPYRRGYLEGMDYAIKLLSAEAGSQYKKNRLWKNTTKRGFYFYQAASFLHKEWMRTIDRMEAK